MSARRRGDDPWDVTNRPHTKAKLRLLRDYFTRWLIIWNGPNQRAWASKTWYIVDLFAGTGTYSDNGTEIAGSPLVYLECISEQCDQLENNDIEIRILLVEKSVANHNKLKARLARYFEANPHIAQIVAVEILCDDCNGTTIWNWLDTQPLQGKRSPMFVLIDPYGFAIKRQTMDRLMDIGAAKDVLFNYMVSGVKRAQGIAAKDDASLSRRERSTLKTYVDFLGRDVQLHEDADSPQEYAQAVFTSRGYKVAAYDMDYPGRVGTLYYLLFATKNPKVATMARKMFGQAKKSRHDGQMSLMDEDQLTAAISVFEPEGAS